MTDPAPGTAPPAIVNVEPGTQLASLLAEYETLKPQLDPLKKRLEALTKAIKLRAIESVPDWTPRIAIQSQEFGTYGVEWRGNWRLDTPRLKDEQPQIYAAYAVQSGAWVLTKDKGH